MPAPYRMELMRHMERFNCLKQVPSNPVKKVWLVVRGAEKARFRIDPLVDEDSDDDEQAGVILHIDCNNCNHNHISTTTTDKNYANKI